MCTLAYIERLFNNQSVGAFLGALTAFLLVMLTDWRRNRRKARNILREIENSRSHAEKKRQTVIERRDELRNQNRVMPGPFIHFNTGLIRQLSTEVLDQLTQEQRRAIDAICFRMEGSDQLLDEAYVTARMFSDPNFQSGRTTKVKELVDYYDDAIVNLGILVQMCEQFAARDFNALLTAEYDRREFEAP